MTQQVRNGYRKHRKGTWGFAALVALLLAAIVIPLASGGGGKTYTFTGDNGVCNGTSSTTFSVVLTNTSTTSQNLGSADLYAPVNISVTGATITSGGGSGYIINPIGQATLPGDPAGSQRSLISLRNLTLPAGGSPVTVQVSANVVGTGVSSWYSLAKQANSFNPGDLDTSNTLTLKGANPTFTVSTCTLQFVTSPPSAWQKNIPLTNPVAVAVFAGTTRVAMSGTPTLSVATGSAGATSDFSSIDSATGPSADHAWSWPDAKPKSTAPSGSYKLFAQLGSMTATSESFQVVDAICPAGQTCPPVDTSTGPNGEGAGALGINNTLSSTVELSFTPVLDPDHPPCTPWNRASYLDSTGTRVYFPSLQLGYTTASGKALQITYLVRNSEWVLTDASRGNNDIEFCVGAHHQSDPTDSTHPFAAKYGPASWDGVADYWGVLNSVANPSKVKSGGDPAVCGRGTTDRPTGPGGTSETWRFWTVCIPYDWDFKVGG